MTDYPFNMQLAVTSLDENTVVRDGSVSVYDPEDTDGTVLLTLTTPGGVPLTNPLTTNEYGFVQPFIATLPQVMWRSGDYEGYFESYKGLRDVAVAASDDAAVSALMATEAANGLQIGTVEAGVDPAATITGDAPDRLLNFVLPQGPEGPEGPPGTVGPLDNLTDVTAPSPSNGQALIWDAATSLWKNTTIPTPASTLDGLTDVTAPSPVNGQALVWDSGTSQWKNTTLVTPPSTLDSLTDVTAPSPTNGQALMWDSATSQWRGRNQFTVSTTAPTAPVNGDVWFDIS